MLTHGLGRNHPFVDGNKRTAHFAYRTLLVLNGAELIATKEDNHVAMMALGEGKLAERDFAAWLRERLEFTSKGKAHEPRRAYRAKPRPPRDGP